MSLAEIKERIAAAEAQSNRASGTARLIAVSKVQPPARIEAVLQQGHRIYGENRVQEAQGKWPAWKDSYEGVELHLLGPLQTNKARAALELFDVLHTLDRPKLANTFARLAQETGTCPPMFVQVNTGEEPQKAGVLPADVDAFVADCRAMDLPILGLMCIPPVDEEPALHFSLLAKMAERNGLERLSMGMSADYELAVRLGATDVRVGSAIFGARTTIG
ncbi:MAG: YggS family pyridoxal phosphate-dependent enzyme [Rhodobacteraceae bacterium]|nr:YggS family pyridoxal phosphate-dependent enzyme [Paracoccaceae bacterium]